MSIIRAAFRAEPERLRYWEAQNAKKTEMEQTREKILSESDNLESLKRLMDHFIDCYGQEPVVHVVDDMLYSTTVNLTIDFTIPQEITGRADVYGEDTHRFMICAHFIHGEGGSQLAGNLMNHVNNTYYRLQDFPIQTRVQVNNNFKKEIFDYLIYSWNGIVEKCAKILLINLV